MYDTLREYEVDELIIEEEFEEVTVYDDESWKMDSETYYTREEDKNDYI